MQKTRQIHYTAPTRPVIAPGNFVYTKIVVGTIKWVYIIIMRKYINMPRRRRVLLQCIYNNNMESQLLLYGSQEYAYIFMLNHHHNNIIFVSIYIGIKTGRFI